VTCTWLLPSPICNRLFPQSEKDINFASKTYKNPGMKYSLFLLIIAGTLACTSTTENSKTETASVPQNIILLIGDGMGLSQVSTGFYFGEGPSQFLRFRTIGLQRTSSATHKITDSAASGTAMATGTKTYNGAIGLDTAGNAVTNMTEQVSTLGLATGIISTSSVTHATPASFYAHVKRRNMEQDIAAQLLDSEVDFFAGGGTGFFTGRSDGKDLVAEAEKKGFIMDTVSLTDPGDLDRGGRYGFLLAEGGMPPASERGDFLPEATSLAISALSAEEKGFFLMVEGSQIDWAGHDNDAKYLVGEMLDFEKAIRAALDFAEKDGQTLVVVTADHETGGYTLSAFKDKETGRSDYDRIQPTFATGGHSATLLPVFAFGPGSELFSGIYENTALYEKMVELLAR